MKTSPQRDKLEIRRINASDTINMRLKFLYPGCSHQRAIYPGDEDGQSFHLGAFENSKLISIASFIFEKHPEIASDHQYRLRGMVTVESFRKRGIGRELLKMAFPVVKQNSCDYLWCHAREDARGFYLKTGFEQSNGPYHISDIGLHYLMTKKC